MASIHTIPKNTFLYSRRHSRDPPSGREPTWFAFDQDYGADVYGEFLHTFRVQKPLRVYDVAKKETRQVLASLAKSTLRDDKHKYPCLQRQEESPYWKNQQPFSYILHNAWGAGCNMEAAQVVCELGEQTKPRVSGWIAVDWDEEEMEGPEEVMLCNLRGLDYLGVIVDK